MVHSKWLKAVATLGIATTCSVGTVASASPGEGVSAETFVTADNLEDVNINHDRVKLQTKGVTNVRVQKLIFAPGARTGWHHHPGTVVVAVQSGSVTLVDADCSTKTYGPGLPNGSVFVEGHDHAHEARSTSGATVYATYVTEAGFRVEDPAQTCS
jgi:quercetin dioxygenase-like cupin family protein